MGLPNQSPLSLLKLNHLMLRLISVENYFITFKFQSKMRNNTKRLKIKKGNNGYHSEIYIYICVCVCVRARAPMDDKVCLFEIIIS